MRPLRIFVGYDQHEADAFAVCAESLRRHATVPLMIEALDVRMLQHAGLYRREWRYIDGQFIDTQDRRPFSTEFAFSRFLVPALCQWQGRALFCDSDFLWRGDIAELLRAARGGYAVEVVKHDHRPVETAKMEGRVQTRYYRKNWSSLMLFDCGHPANLLLTPHQVNRRPGQWLHALAWLEDHAIGGLDATWNWLEGSSTPMAEPKAVHMTRGGPWHASWQDVAFADEWRAIARSIGLAGYEVRP